MKRTICALMAALLLLTGSAFAASGPDTEPKQTIEELQAKWDVLTDRQKNGIYRLFNKRGRTEIALMNEYARLGLVTEKEAQAFADRVASWLNAMERSGGLPPVYGYAPQRNTDRQDRPAPVPAG